MATRSTIKIMGSDEWHTPTVHLYRHCDGYPAGMAEVLIEAQVERHGSHRLAERIICAGNCEIIKHVDEISDVQYRYMLEWMGSYLRITTKDVWSNQTWTQPVEDFIDDYRGRRCPVCGKRPRVKIMFSPEEGKSEVHVKCCEPFVATATSMSAAVMAYNRKVLGHRCSCNEGIDDK